MTTKTIDTSSVKQSVDLRELAARFTELRRASGDKELCGPCPKCGGNDRFHCQADWFSCRQCHPKRGDAIEFFMWLNGVDFKSAVAMLTNSPMPSTTTKRTPAPKHQAEQPQDWQRKAATQVKQAHQRLMNDADVQAEVGRQYLDNRGLQPHTWIAFNLGFTPSASLPGTEGKKTAPALVVPWYRAGKVCAIRYRFLRLHEYTDTEGKERKEKQTALTGSSFAGVLFGGQALDVGIKKLSTLIICEGELNDCSIWQTVKDMHVHVFSLGSESATITPAMVEYTAQYARVIVWLDKQEIAQKVMAALPGAHGVKSPNGQDANDLLKSEALGGFLALHRFQAARNRNEQEAMLWDTWDDAQVWPGPDESTNEVMSHIAQLLGITL